jgi:hypothetical protein
MVAASIASKSCIALARVTARSFIEHNPGIPFYLLLADEEQGLINPANEPFSIIRMDQLALDEPARFRFQYTEMEMSYALTPHLIEHLLNVGFDAVMFLKQETLVLDELGTIFDKLGRYSVLLTPHLLDPGEDDEALTWEINVLQAGVFNGGFVAFNNSNHSRRFLGWWKEKTARECFRAVEAGIHFEQRWLNFAPAFVPDHLILHDPGMNVGHWNLGERHVEALPDGRVTAGGGRCRIIRFSGYDPDVPEQTSKYHPDLTLNRSGGASSVFRHYHQLLMEAGHEETRQWPYAFALFDNGVRIPDIVRRIYHDMPDAGERFGDPFCTAPAGSFYRWLNMPADSGGKGVVTNFWRKVYLRRPDLHPLFKDLGGECREAFESWITTTGVAEYGSMQP